MTLIGGVLIFLAAVIPIITNILRLAIHKGVPASLLASVCLGLVALACYATAFIGWVRKWNVNFVLSYALMYAILYAAAFALAGAGIPSRPEIALFVGSFFFVGAFVALVISRA
jgi:hypothetical protein